MKNFLSVSVSSSSLIELLLAAVVIPVTKPAITYSFCTTAKPIGPGNYDVSGIIFRARIRPV